MTNDIEVGISLQNGKTYKRLRLLVLSLAWTFFFYSFHPHQWLVKTIRQQTQPTFGQFCFADSIAHFVVFDS